MSESFTNDAGVLAGAFHSYPDQCACTAGGVGLQIFFDVLSGGYSVTSGGVSHTFLPSDLDPLQTSTTISVYQKSSDTWIETLSLTKPGTSGALTYQYVGAGFWQRATLVNDHTDLDFRAFTYGVETADSALPRTGSAGYAVDVVGAMGGEVPKAISGTGTLSVNFGSGALTTTGTLNERSIDTGDVLATATFNGQAQLSSGANAFSGTFGFDSNGLLSGGLNGRFYGPGAEEVGAVWTAANADGRAATGTITGRKDAGANIALASAKTAVEDPAEALAISYDAASQSYTLVAAGEILSLTAADRDVAGGGAAFDLFRKTLADGGTLDARIHNAAGSPLALSYTSFAELVFHRADGVTETLYQAFGQRTAASQMPRTGSASYNGAVYGGGAVQGAAATAFYTLGGTSRLDVDFASNRASGSLAITGTNADGGRDFGAFDFQSYAMSAGQFSASPTTPGATGSVNGAFFGPNAQEFGANFAIRQGYANGDTATLTGVTIGKKAP